MTNKKKSLTTSHIFVSGGIFDFDARTINDVSVNILDDNLQFKLKKDVRGICHICSPVKEFKSLDELNKHSRTVHAQWRH